MKPAVEAEEMMWRIAMKPGRPLAFGSVKRSFFIGLPGNPVSSFVTFLIFVRPFLLKTQGLAEVAQKHRRARGFRLAEPDARREFLRVKWNAQGGLDLYPTQDSAVLTSTAWATAWSTIPPRMRFAKAIRCASCLIRSCTGESESAVFRQPARAARHGGGGRRVPIRRARWRACGCISCGAAARGRRCSAT